MENDPTGRDPNAPGAKLDAGKLRASLVLGDFANALTAVCAVGTFGAKKYSDHGWLSVPQAPGRYSDAMMRHWLAMQRGEELDEQSGLTHLAHFAWNALALLEMDELQRDAIGATNSISSKRPDALLPPADHHDSV